MSKFGFRDFDYDFTWVNNKVDYFKEKIKELYDELREGRFRINDNIDLTSNELENIAEDELGHMFGRDYGVVVLDDDVIDDMINEDNAELVFDSFFSKVMRSIIDKIKTNIIDLEDKGDYKDDLSEIELDELEEDIRRFDDFIDDFEDKSIDYMIQNWMSPDRVETIKNAERCTIKKAEIENERRANGLDNKYPVYPNIGEIANPNISDHQARTIYEAATDNIDLPSVVQGMGKKIEDLSDQELYDIYHSCALDKEINNKDVIRFYNQDLRIIINAKSNNTIDNLIIAAQKAAAEEAKKTKKDNVIVSDEKTM